LRSEIDDLLAASIAEIEVALHDPEREEGEVTVEEYAKQMNLSISQARDRLDKGVERRQLVKRLVRIGKTYKSVYKAVK